MQPFYTTLGIHRARSPMGAIGPSAPQAQVPTGILESAAQVPVPIPTAPKGACPQGANPPVRHFPVPSNFKGEYHGKDLIHQ